MSTVGSADNGRRPDGKFGAGNSFARGNPVHRRVARLRAEYLRAATPQAIRKLMGKLQELGEAGDVAAIREFFLRCTGPADSFDLAARIGALEELVATKASGKPNLTLRR